MLKETLMLQEKRWEEVLSYYSRRKSMSKVTKYSSLEIIVCVTGGEVWGEALLHVAAWEIRNFPMTETTSAAGDGEFMILYFISSQFYSDSMNIKCNKKVIYSRREFCIGVQEKRICSENTEEKFRKWLLTLCCNLLNYRFCLSSGKKFHTTTGRGSTKISNFFHSCSYRIFLIFRISIRPPWSWPHCRHLWARSHGLP